MRLPWPPPDQPDKDAREAFLVELRKTDAEHAKVLEADIGAPRISPEELIAAAAGFPHLGTFDNLQDGSAAVRSRIGTQ